METDIDYMRKALVLARRGEGLVSPNPMVGAVLVKDGRVVGEGYHRYDRLKHAESFAIEMAGERSQGATLYCSLEPCCHYGRTPPCADALIEAGIARAVVAMADPDGRVSGRGIERLRDAGIEVEVGLCEKEARRLNECYLKFVTTLRPFVHAVIESALYTEWSPSARLLETAMRYDAILLGHNREINRIFLERSLTRERHRPLVVIGSAKAFEVTELMRSTSTDNSKAMLIETTTAVPDLDSMLDELARHRVTSVLVLPQLPVLDARSVAAKSDHVTLIAPWTAMNLSEPEAAINSILAATLDERETLKCGEAVEITGYVRPREPANPN